MTAHWGPLGWMTLHSVSLIYPEEPSAQEIMLASKFLQAFADSISCPACKNHFRGMLETYKLLYPDYLNSRQNFAVFVFRAHNTVNARLDKPKPQTVSQCLDTLQIATSQTSFKQFRSSYVSYLMNNWGREMSGEAMMVKKSVKEVKKIIDEYWDPRDNGVIPELEEDDILTPIQKENIRFTSSWRPFSTSVGFKGGKLKLTRR